MIDCTTVCVYGGVGSGVKERTERRCSSSLAVCLVSDPMPFLG